MMRGHLRWLDLDIFICSHADGVEGTEHAVERFFLLLGEKLHVLDAGELVVERVRHLYSLQIHGENRFFPFRGDSDLFGDIFDSNEASVAKSTNTLALRMARRSP